MKEASLESYVQYVYEIILNLKGGNIVVSKNAIMIGTTGVKHEIDVYYQFDKANISHKVAIECKDHSRAISKGLVQEFYAKIEDLNNIVGVIVSKNGYQSGAKEYAKAKGIISLTSQDLPTIPDLLSKQIHKFFLPDKTDIGEPFWTIMEVLNDGNVTGNYYTPHKDDKGRTIIMLFFSKKHANEFISFTNISNSEYQVRGLRQYHLKGMFPFLEKANVVFGVTPPYVPTGIREGAFFLKTVNEIKDEFFLKDTSNKSQK